MLNSIQEQCISNNGRKSFFRNDATADSMLERLEHHPDFTHIVLLLCFQRKPQSSYRDDHLSFLI